MILRTGRRPIPPGAARLLYPKIAAFVLGAAAGLLGIAMHVDWLVTAAVLILGIGFVLRFIGRERDDTDGPG